MFSYIQLINNFSQTVSMKNAYVGNSATQQKKIVFSSNFTEKDF